MRMGNAIDRAKIIDELEGVMDPSATDLSFAIVEQWVVRDALALLKAQEPHVIRFDEIDNYEVLWLEVRDVETEDGLAPWIKTASGRWFSPLLCSETRPDMILSTPREYGRICRCWTSRPTDEQREATPWE